MSKHPLGVTILASEVGERVRQIFAKLQAEPTSGCVPGGGQRSVRVADRLTRITRALVALRDGELPADKVVMHTCDNPACINPEHLVVGTQVENMADMLAKGRGRKHKRWQMLHLTHRPSHPRRKPVADGSGRTWPSASLAADDLGLTRQAVAHRCRQRIDGWHFTDSERA